MSRTESVPILEEAKLRLELGRIAHDASQHVDVELDAKARSRDEQALILRRQLLDRAHQVLDDVLGALGVLRDALHVPLPPMRLKVEPQQLLLVDGLQELLDEERVAGRLVHDQLGERRRLLLLAADRVRDELRDDWHLERAHLEVDDRTAGFLQLRDGQHQRMAGFHLGVTVCQNHQQVCRYLAHDEAVYHEKEGVSESE